MKRCHAHPTGCRKVAALIVCRNEEDHIGSTIDSLKRQTYPVDLIVVVDDGSTDNTRKIAESKGCIVLSLPYHEESYVGRPELAERWNIGLAHVRKFSPDYVLLMGADHVLPPNYVEEILKRMKGKVVIASGRIRGEPFVEMAPRGSGRIVKTSFWIEINNMQYPVIWGWESWLCYKALQLGYEVKCFKDVVTNISRPTGLGKAEYLGKAMYALGYYWGYALGRCFLTFLRSPNAGLKMFLGWIIHKDVKRADTAKWVSNMQKQLIWNRIKLMIRKNKSNGKPVW